MSLVENERTKLTATFLNGIAIAVFAVGSFAPTIASLGATGTTSTTIRMIAVICLLASGALHLTARGTLRGLRNDN
ncbi:amino acid transporter [Rhizobium sp. BG4]|jgi:hypothetical protein|uniref:amino acid transporter n=1 Tax=unclassified Rhizobium TaxID=2613769 RepID=UPI000DD53447|nr:amino acid transporter [Rhizobium sp. BG4]QRM42397.1 amino acid transporter [Rhizobium sp. BG4]